MKNQDRVKMYNAILAHGQNLNNIFNTGIEPVTLCKKLQRLEKKASHATTCLCNTNTLNLMELNRATGYDVKQATEEEQDVFFDKITKAIHKILGEQSKEVFFINFDPRGYALKLRSDFVKGKNIMTDWGGYGILAPDFTPNN
jgi:hypothetical protein